MTAAGARLRAWMKKWGCCWHLRARACINVWTVSATWQCFLRRSGNSFKKHRTQTAVTFGYNRFLLGYNRSDSRTTSHEWGGDTEEGCCWSSWWMSKSWSFWGMTYPATKSRARVFFSASRWRVWQTARRSHRFKGRRKYLTACILLQKQFWLFFSYLKKTSCLAVMLHKFCTSKCSNVGFLFS